jgi:hypothetical protein
MKEGNTTKPHKGWSQSASKTANQNRQMKKKSMYLQQLSILFVSKGNKRTENNHLKKTHIVPRAETINIFMR